MDNKYLWLSRRSLRSVSQLNLWPENPRLNPQKEFKNFKGIVSGLIETKKERDNFLDLLKSIATRGFIPADPIVIYIDLETNKSFVAEGNRRVAALKLLLDPTKSPKSIKSSVRKFSKMCNLEELKKISVNIAPTFEDAEWYINQRNGILSLQYGWTRVQQLNYISTLFDKYGGDIEKLHSIIDIESGDLDSFLRILKIKDFSKTDVVKEILTKEEYDEANSHHFPITILERFFGFSEVRDAWGIEFDGSDVIIDKFENENGFLFAYGHLIKRILTTGDNKINTRFKKEDVKGILDSLPKVENLKVVKIPEAENVSHIGLEGAPSEPENQLQEGPLPVFDNPPITAPIPYIPPVPIYRNPNRNRLNYENHFIDTSEYKLSAVFEELKYIPTSRYPFATAALIRIFLDIAVLVYINDEGLEAAILAKFNKNNMRDVTLIKRLEFLKSDSPIKNIGICSKIIQTLLNMNSEFNLDILNGYMHSPTTHYTQKEYLNSLWDFILPLFENMFKIDKR